MAPALPTLEGGIGKSCTNVLFGARYITPISDHWRLAFTGDISGGDTEGTFSIDAYAGYRTGKPHFIGYKHFGMDLESGNGGDLTGPVIAYGYSF